jgi:protein CMS1
MSGSSDVVSEPPEYGQKNHTSEAPSSKRERDPEESATDLPKAKKKKKRRRPRKLNGTVIEEIDNERGINTALAKLDNHLLADHLAQKDKKFQSQLSQLELQERSIPARAIHDTSDWQQERVLENLPAFLESYITASTLSTAPKESGTPHTIVITAAGLRAADTVRTLRGFERKDAKVAKLFAKHIKMNEAIEYLKKIRIGFGVGTPERILALLDNGSLSSEKLKRIVVDMSHVDQKKRGILDMMETREPLMRLLSRKEFQERYTGDKEALQLFFY